MWGRGTTLGAPMPANIPADALLMLRLLALVNETGAGVKVDGDTVTFQAVVRTAFANPPDVVAKLLALTDAQLADKAMLEAIAKASPDSPFAADYEAGGGGLLVPSFVTGAFASIAVPAIAGYMRRSAPPPTP